MLGEMIFTARSANGWLSRRSFVEGATAGAVGAAIGRSMAADEPKLESPMNAATDRLTHLSEHLAVYHGPINVGIVHDAGKALLFDCGEGSVAGVLGLLGVTKVDRIQFTHHHRDQACGALELVAHGARLGVPAAERPYFDNVSAYWTDPKSRWHLYNQHPHHLMLAEPVPVADTYADGDSLSWGPAEMRVLATPGHTDGSVTYLVEVDGKRTAFCGDAICGHGQVWELYSLQKGTQTTDYHGFLGARPELVRSLARLKEARPDLVVPSHGRITDDPPEALDALVARLDACYDKYVAISALRHYYPKLFEEYAGRGDHLPLRPGKPVPDCLRHFGTTWMLVSEDKSAFVMDCGGPQVIEEIRALTERGEIGEVEGLWVTHYHDDHVDAIPAFQQAFDCRCLTDRSVAAVITNPRAWRLPCISPSVCRVDRATEDGESWRWHEFQLTAYHFPGQTLYHSGLFVEGRGLRMLFTGDSFTMAGIDDYCAHNRNWLGRGVGFDRCLALIEKLHPTHLFNCHVNEAFDFTPEESRFMRANLAEREKLFGDLTPWDHPNYGMDEPWVRCYPYEQRTKPGEDVRFRVGVTNHSAQPRTATCRAVAPRAWGDAVTPTDWVSAAVPAKSDGELQVRVSVPPGVLSGRYVVPVDLRYGQWSLPQWTEAIVVV
ncbi:MAG: hypothetical protein AUJ96_06475 [Armatimonadetes bacterium CG2_30_66_41]|nr:MAG: hypothetical protein AUJ96_06475 [Armatimonadetes bacterium CG2_30_66_41]